MNPTSRIHIAIMKAEDCPAVASLLPDLGYGGTSPEVEQRLTALREWPDQEVYLAWLEGTVVGLCHIQGIRLIASAGYAEVQALVVAASHQRSGIGSALVEHVTQWAFSRHYPRVRLRSGVHREEAHLFYESLGFKKSRASFAFERSTPQNAD